MNPSAQTPVDPLAQGVAPAYPTPAPSTNPPSVANGQPVAAPQQPFIGLPPSQTAAVFNGQASGGQQPQAAVPPPRTNPNSTQNTLQIAEIRDGIVIMNDGSFRSVAKNKRP
jgi:hypothetical protein